jgi:hypothetical protein
MDTTDATHNDTATPHLTLVTNDIVGDPTPATVDQVLDLRWEHDPDRNALRLVESDGLQSATISRASAELQLPAELPAETAQQLATSLNVNTWKAEAEVLHQRTGLEEAADLRELAEAALADRGALAELEQRSGVELPPLGGPSVAEDVLTARWERKDTVLEYDGPSSPNSLGEPSTEPSFYAPVATTSSLDNLERWMTVEAWYKESEDRLAWVPPASPSELRELTELRDLSRGVLEGDEEATRRLQERTDLDVHFDPAWREEELPDLKMAVARRPVEPEVQPVLADAYGWQRERFAAAGLSEELGLAAEQGRALAELQASDRDGQEFVVVSVLKDRGFDEQDAAKAIVVLSPGLDRVEPMPEAYAQAIARDVYASRQLPTVDHDGPDV